MRVLVCGSRDFNDYKKLEEELDEWRFKDQGREYTSLIHGAARGADRLAGIYGKSLGIPVLSFPADWNKHGRAAGPIRNEQMLSEGKPDIVFAFWDGKSIGTKHMIDISRKAGVRVKVVESGVEIGV